MNSDQHHQQANQALYQRIKLFTHTSQALKKWKSLAGKSKNRYKRLEQLLTTEETYYNDLITIKQKVIKPFIQQNIITKEQAVKMFDGIQSMIQLSDNVRNEVGERFKKFDRRTTTIGDVMNKFAQFMLLYSDYFKHLATTQVKIREILRINEKAQQIQKQLSTETKTMFIDDLIIKPFQRPMKYHLILKDYYSKLDQNHPDYPHLTKAIKSYLKINQQNNEAMQKKQRNSKLIQLDKRFEKIIQSDARYYINQYQAFVFQLPVTLYLFSDMVIVAQNLNNNKQYIRIAFNKSSLVKKEQDCTIYQNRLYIYGKFYCLHLHFSQPNTRDQVYLQFKGLIEDMNKNENTRQKIMAARISRNSLELKLKRKYSMSDLQPQFVKPLIAEVIGNERRQIFTNKSQTYFVIKFYVANYQFQQNYQPQYLAYIKKQKLQRIQLLVRQLYVKYLRINSLNYIPKPLTQLQLKLDQNRYKKIELDNILINLFLNNIFRSYQVLKRIDIIARQLNIPQSLWTYLKTKADASCFCQLCIMEKYKTYEEYFEQKNMRLANKYTKDHWTQNKQVQHNQFCQIRTIKSQQYLALLPPSQIIHSYAQHRIQWIKHRLGYINHSLTNRFCNSQFTKRLTIKIYFYSIYEEGLEVEVYANDRVRRIIDQVGRIKGVYLDDYVLQVKYDRFKYVLHDDEVIGDVIIKEQPGIISKIFFMFAQEEVKEIPFFLKKMWVFQKNIQKLNPKKNAIEIEQMIVRIKNQELRLNDQQNYHFYSYYFAYHNFDIINDLTVKAFKQKYQAYLQAMPERFLKKNILHQIYSKLQMITLNKFTKDDILRSIIELVTQKPGWSCVMFDALQLNEDNQILSKVKIGCDIRGVQVRDIARLPMKYIFKFEQHGLNYWINGQEMKLRCGQNVFRFVGSNIWKIKLQIEFYHIYFTSFILQ